GAVHRPDAHDRHDRARLLHAADPLPQHARRPLERARRGARRGARHGHDRPAAAVEGRAAARAAGDRRRPADRDRDLDQPRHGRGVRRRRRARRPDLRRAAAVVQDRADRGGRPVRAARARRGRAAGAAPARAQPLDPGGARMSAFVDALRFIGDNASLLWKLTLDHLALSGAALAIAFAFALPLGVWLGHLHRGSFAAINVANIGRALPSLALISIGVALLGIGFVNVMVALVVLAVPPLLTNAYV